MVGAPSLLERDDTSPFNQRRPEILGVRHVVSSKIIILQENKHLSKKKPRWGFGKDPRAAVEN